MQYSGKLWTGVGSGVWRVWAAAVVVSAAYSASAARAADRVYWGDGTGISFANLDGSGGSDLDVTGATTTNQAFGLGVDSSAGRVYWASAGDFGAVRVSFANLNDTGGGGNLNIAGATANEPGGLAIDPVARRVYWANTNGGVISWAALDGSGGHDLSTTGATATKALGLAVDPALGKIYWSDFGAVNKIAFAKLDGSGGGDLTTGTATVSDPAGVAIDAANGKLYWANLAASKISFANLDNTGGGGDLAIPAGATVNQPQGVAIDATAGKIYWANSGPGTTDANTISWAKLDGSGGGNLKTTGASGNSASFPVLVESPLGTGTPAITGGSAVGSVLTCGAASWAADLPGEFLYRAPQSTAFQWTLAGKDIAGATASTLTAFVPGVYGCRATASNAAGATAQTSAAVSAPTPTPKPKPKPKPTKAVMTALTETNATFTVGSTSTPLTGRTAVVHHHKGTVFSFRLDQPATVKIGIQTVLTGRRVGGRCVAASTALRHKPRCTRTLTVATLTRTGHTALNKVAFSGRISGRTLKPGSYRAVFTATDAAGSARPQTLNFTIATR